MPKVPQKFFKYLKKEHLVSFFKHGEIRIGTLLNFQNSEQHSHHILDSEEGIKTANKTINWSGGPEDQPEFDKKFIRVGAKNVTIENVLVREVIKSPDCFIYSLSASFSTEMMKKMNPEYDACFIIHNPNKFIHAISRKLQGKISEWGFGPCHYIDRHLPHDKQHNIHPAWIKDPEYSYQEEYRMIMTTTLEKIEPFNINSKYATKFCKPYKIA